MGSARSLVGRAARHLGLARGGGLGANRGGSLTIGSRADARTVVQGLPAQSADLEVRVRGLDPLRTLTIVGQSTSAARVRLAVSGVPLPWKGWRASLPLPGVDVAIRWPEGRTGTLVLTVTGDVNLAALARAVLVMLRPHGAGTGAESVQLAVAPTAPDDVLALLTTPWVVPPIVEPEPEVLPGNDVVLTGLGDDAGHQGPVVRSVDEVRAALGPVLDPHLYHPIGRPLAALTVPEAFGAALERGDAGAWSVVDAAGTELVRLRADTPLDADALRALRRVPAVSARAAADGTAPWARLAELAAAGVLVHDAPNPAAPDPWADPELVATMGAVPSGTAALLARGAAQRRAALRRYAGPVQSQPGRVGELARLLADPPHVTVVLTTNRPHLVAGMLGQMAAQTYPHLDVVVVLHGGSVAQLSPADAATVREHASHVVEVPGGTPLGHALALGTERAAGPLFTKIDDDDHYGPEHVWDLVLARTYSGATVVGKQAELVYLMGSDTTIRRAIRSERYSPQVAGGTILMSVADLRTLGGWRPVPRAVDRAMFQRLIRAGGLTYVASAVGYVYVRHDQGHTWVMEDEHFRRTAVEEWAGLPTELLG